MLKCSRACLAWINMARIQVLLTPKSTSRSASLSTLTFDRFRRLSDGEFSRQAKGKPQIPSDPSRPHFALSSRHRARQFSSSAARFDQRHKLTIGFASLSNSLPFDQDGDQNHLVGDTGKKVQLRHRPSTPPPLSDNMYQKLVPRLQS